MQFGPTKCSRGCGEEKRDFCVPLNCTMTEVAEKCDLKVNCVIGWTGQGFYS